MSNHYCYYCAAAWAEIPLKVSPTFTAGNMVKIPTSDVMCDRCEGIMFGAFQRVWYFNQADGGRWASLYLRGIHQLWSGDTLIAPELGSPEEHISISASGNAGYPQTYHVLKSIPKRAEVREWLVNPPEPPFTIAIAETGQKHILFLAQAGYDRNNFPVQFEMDSLSINRPKFVDLLSIYEQLLILGFSKTEIDSGEYRPDRLVGVFDQWQQLDAKIAMHRSANKPSRMLQLISFVAIKPEAIPNHVAVKEPTATQITNKQKKAGSGQLSLF